jgi:hypothetical protein
MKAFAFASLAAVTFADKPTTAPSVQCTVKGPSFTINGDCRVAGPWPIRGVKDKESCASKCRLNSDCAAFHYYGADDFAYGDCYLHCAGKVEGPLSDGRDRYAGICREVDTFQLTVTDCFPGAWPFIVELNHPGPLPGGRRRRQRILMDGGKARVGQTTVKDLDFSNWELGGDPRWRHRALPARFDLTVAQAGQSSPLVRCSGDAGKSWPCIVPHSAHNLTFRGMKYYQAPRTPGYPPNPIDAVSAPIAIDLTKWTPGQKKLEYTTIFARAIGQDGTELACGKIDIGPDLNCAAKGYECDKPTFYHRKSSPTCVEQCCSRQFFKSCRPGGHSGRHYWPPYCRYFCCDAHGADPHEGCGSQHYNSSSQWVVV